MRGIPGKPATTAASIDTVSQPQPFLRQRLPLLGDPGFDTLPRREVQHGQQRRKDQAPGQRPGQSFHQVSDLEEERRAPVTMAGRTTDHASTVTRKLDRPSSDRARIASA